MEKKSFRVDCRPALLADLAAVDLLAAVLLVKVAAVRAGQVAAPEHRVDLVVPAERRADSADQVLADRAVQVSLLVADLAADGEVAADSVGDVAAIIRHQSLATARSITSRVAATFMS